MEYLEDLLPTPRRLALQEHFHNRFLNQPDEQLGGVRETIGNYLQYFLTPEIAEVFCTGESTFDFSAIDQGKIILHDHAAEIPDRTPLCEHVSETALLQSCACAASTNPKPNAPMTILLILWADEAQRFMTASEDGTSDYNCVDVIREAGATIVAAAQSTTSFVPPLGNDKSKVLTLNLRNRMIFRAADEAGRRSKRRFSRQETGRETLLGLQRRQAQRELQRNRGTQNQTAQTPQSPRPRVRACPLRTGFSPRDVAAVGIGR